MDKPLKDWTLEEIKEQCCKNDEFSCYTCPLNDFCCEYIVGSPENWDFNEN